MPDSGVPDYFMFQQYMHLHTYMTDMCRCPCYILTMFVLKNIEAQRNPAADPDLFPFPNNMLCPVCEKSQTKKFWSTTQWTRRQATFKSEVLSQHFNCCKECSATYNSDGLPAACGALDKQRKAYEEKKQRADHKYALNRHAYMCAQEALQPDQPASSKRGNSVEQTWQIGNVTFRVFLKSSEQDTEHQEWPPADTISVQDPTDLDLEFSALVLNHVPQSYIEELLNAMRAIPKQIIQKLALRWLDWTNFQGTNVKFFSHFGAIQLRTSNRNACSWIDPKTKKGFHDPTNRVYSMVIEQFWPQLPQGRNLGTQGDILEAVLGWGFVLEEKLNTSLDLIARFS